jgi:hypothetical protein
MMTRSELDNGEYMMRRYWEAQEARQQARNDYCNQHYLTPRGWSNALPVPYAGRAGGWSSVTPGEAAAEDTTGLRLLEEFLVKRRRARDGDERK